MPFAPFPIVIVLVLSSLAAMADDSWHAPFEKKEIVAGELTLPYRQADLGETGQAPRPLVLFLHGAGERGTDNTAQLKHGLRDLVAWCKKNKLPCAIVAPQCPPGSWWAETKGGYKSPDALRLAKTDSPVTTALLTLVDRLVQDQGIDAKRVYLTGLSMGGYGSFALLERRPDTFAAAMPVCGGGDLTTAGKIKEVPMWIFHGGADSVVPVVMSRKMVEALKSAGGTPKYREYAGVGHDSWGATYADPEVWAWLFAQSR